ncbi:MAG TPA: heme-copper oxidase subunit III [Nocardioidaceae bacterium]|nr:heme-copper oxidase subunit III [Nocardioidaceae bacterium]
MTTMERRPTPTTPERTERHAPERPVGHTTGYWGMVLFICTEATTFATFLASYFYLRFAGSGPWPPTGDPLPELFWSSLETGALLVSVVPMAVAVRTVAKGRRTGGLLMLALVWALGAAFVSFQIMDYLVSYPQSTLSSDAFGSLYYTITGLHTAHVVVGLLMLIAVIASTALGRLGKRRPEPVALMAMYWYFLAVLSLAIYVVVYISPYA